MNKWLDVDIQSSGLHLEGLYSAYVSTCPSSSVSSSSASSSSSGGGWGLWGWEHQRDFSNVIHINNSHIWELHLLFQLRSRWVRKELVKR